MDIVGKKRNALIKVMAGVVFMIAGLAGLIFGRNVKQLTLRMLIIVLSAVCLGGGFYLFVDGLDELAIGQVGNYQLSEGGVQPLIYRGPAFMKAGVASAVAHQPKLRRLHFKCPDGSKGFTVYPTKLGVFGVPKRDIICNDGFKLLTYGKRTPKAQDEEG